MKYLVDGNEIEVKRIYLKEKKLINEEILDFFIDYLKEYVDNEHKI